MEYKSKVDYKEVISEWAKREKKCTSQLLQSRSPLLGALPESTIWFKVSIDKVDLDSLRVINSDISWQIVSDFTGEIKRIAQNLPMLYKYPPRLPHKTFPDGRTLQQYVSDRIRSLQEFRVGAGDEGHNLTLILISSSKEGPFTILEGNHTAVGLYFRYFIDNPELPYPIHDSYVGISASMDRCPWYWPP